MRTRYAPILLALLALGSPAAAQDEDLDEGEAAPARSSNYRPYTSTKGTFACDIPVSGWNPFEEDTPFGSSAHFLGPAEENGTWRAALHVHFVDKGQPGFVPIDDAVKRERRSEPFSEREAAGPVRRVRVSRASARRFEVNETRLAPADRLPAAPFVIHHFFAFVPAGDGYFIVKLSTSRDTYLRYRELFDRVLQTFRILGY
ncbi:MAG: hypothetical protein HY553_16480 [Elusimicrobia bacterium]|nr:hypothetical protein [Elusimicrobiota bacterium]